jgi:hypothetical protein
MTKPIWLLEDVGAESIEPTVEALKQLNIEHYIVEYPISPNFVEDDKCVVFCGSLYSAKMLRKKARWIPGVYYNIPKYECVNYYAYLGEFLFNENYVMLPFGELKRRKEFLYEYLGKERSIFVRPSRGDKTFTGKLIYKEFFDKDVDVLGFKQILPEELIIVAEPRNIAFEWRFIVVDEKVVAGSQYKKNDRIAIEAEFPQGAFDFASKIASIYKTEEAAWVVDVCQTIMGEYKVMEVGCFSCAGLYKSDRHKIVKTVSTAAVREYKSYL